MTEFTISGGAKTAWHNKGFQDGLNGGRGATFKAPKVEGKTLQEAYRNGYWAGRRVSRKQIA